jgi:uncharacterized protein YbjT (DUF2867 family)
MKIVLTGAAGNITKPLAEKLLREGHEVTVLGRSAEKLKILEEKGATIAVGDIEDENFLIAAFKGADAVYTMTPMPVHSTDWAAYGSMVGKNYAEAIKINGITKVVNLSTFGAHLLEGNGPINLLGQVEKALDKLESTEVVHLRAGYFYSNLVNQIPSIKSDSLIGANYGNANNLLLLVHTYDIAEITAKALQTPFFNNGEPYYVVGDVRSLRDIASVLGKSIDKDLTWSEYTDDEARTVFTQMGLPEHLISIFVEIGQAMSKGRPNEHYFLLPLKPELTKIKLEDYADEFRDIYSAE